ncbi:395_t:CDS:2, partial [Gigaspora rosea]
NAKYQSKCRFKKIKQIKEEQTVVRYDVPGRPSFLTQNLDLLEYIHEPVEYRSADSIYGSNNFEQLSSAPPLKNDCSKSGARQFAQAFSDSSIIISQDDKAKIGLGVSAVGRKFRTLQSALEPVNKINDDLQTGQMEIFVKSQWSI